MRATTPSLVLSSLCAVAAVAASGTATAGPIIELWPSVCSEVAIGAPQWLPFSVRNVGDAPLAVTEMAVVGLGADAVRFDDTIDPTCGRGQICDADFTVAAGEGRDFALWCDPVRGGPTDAELRVTSNAESGTSWFSIVFQSGNAPRALVTPLSMDFGIAETERGGSTIAIDITNIALEPALPLWFSYTVYADPYQFSVRLGCSAPEPQCGGGVGQTQTLFVTFHPQYVGRHDVTIDIAPNDPTTPLVRVSGSGIGAVPAFRIDYPPDAFMTVGPAPIGQPTAPAQVIASNPSIVALRLDDVYIEPPCEILEGPTDRSEIAPGATVTWSISCVPQVHYSDRNSWMQFYTSIMDEPHIVFVQALGYGEGILAEPQAVDFGDVALGEAETRTVTVRNTGTYEHVLPRIDVASPAFRAEPRGVTLPVAMAPGDQLLVDVTYAPTAAVAESVGLGFPTLDEAGWTILLRGRGVLVGTDLTPDEVVFGRIELPIVNEPPRAVELRNLGSRPLTVQRLTLDAPADFAIEGIEVGTVVGAGEAVTFRVRATPSALGMRTATLVIDVDTAADIPLRMSAYGQDNILPVRTGDGSVDDFALDIGPVDVDIAARTAAVTLGNQGDAAIEIDACDVTGDPAFAVVGGCPATIVPGATVDVTVAFDPEAEASYAATLTIAGTGFATGVVIVPIAGVGIDQHVALSDPRLDFGDVFRHPTAPVTRTVSLQNTGAEELPVSRVAVEGAAFALVGPPAASLAPGESVTFALAFAPESAGDFGGQLVLGNDADPAMARVDLTGRGVARTVTVTPMTVDLGTILVGETRRLSDVLAGAIGVENIDPAATFTVTSVALAGSADLAAIAPPADPLPPGGRASIDVVFAPTTAGTHEATVSVYLDSDPTAHAVVAVTARATEPEPPYDCGCRGSDRGHPAWAGFVVLALLAGWRRRAP